MEVTLEYFQGVLNRGNCVVCTTSAVLACQRCGDFYCSTKCQRKDWQSHRYICIPMPALVHPQSFSIYSGEIKTKTIGAVVENVPEAQQSQRLENDADKVKANVESIQATQVTPPKSTTPQTPLPQSDSDKMEDFKSEANNNIAIVSSNIIKKIKYNAPPNMSMPANRSIVYITGFRSPNRCFIRDASQIADEAYSNIMEMVDKLGKELPKILKPRNHQYVLSTYNGILQRAKVLSAYDNNLRLLFVDQGVIKVRHASSVIEVSDEIMSLPCFTLQVQLKGVSNYAISDNIIKFLTQFENEKFVGLYANNYNPNNIQLELFHVDTHTCLNKQINEFCADKQLFELNDAKAKMGNVSPSTEVVQKDADPVEAKDNDDKVTKTEAITEVPLPQLKDSERETKKTEVTNESKLDLVEITEPKVAAVPTNDEVTKTETITKISETKLAEPQVIQQPIALKENPSPLNGITQRNNEPILVAPFESVCFKGNAKDGLDVFIVDNSNESKLDLVEITEPKVGAVPTNDEVTKKETITKILETKLAEPQVIQQPIALKENPSPLNGITQRNNEPILVAPFESVCFKGNAKDGLDVFIVDNSNISRGVFGALDSAHAKEFSELQALLSEFVDAHPYEPVLKEYVIVKSDGVWNRAKVTQVDPPFYKVMYLEFVNSEKVTIKDIRRYPIKLTTPCFTNMCFIEEIPNQLNEAQIAHLKNTFKVHSLVHIDSVTYLHNIAAVRCKKLLEELEQLKTK